MRFLAISAALLLVSIIFVASPGAIYSASGEADFPLPLLTYLWPLLIAGFATVAIVAVLANLLPQKARSVLTVALTFLALMVLAETYILLPTFGAFTGASLDFSVSWLRYAAEASAIALAAACAAMWIREPRFWAGACLAICVLAAIPHLWTAFTEEKAIPAAIDEEEIFAVGESGLILVLLDGFPSDVFEEIVEADGSWRERLSGFVYYPDTVGVSTTTFIALPSIHSGSTFSPNTALQPYFTGTIRDRSFLTKLSIAGYTSLLVNPMNGVCPTSVRCVAGVELLDRPSTIRGVGWARLIGLSLFKAAPLAAKETMYDGGAFLLPSLVADQRVTDHNVEGFETLSLFAENLRDGATGPTAKFVHVLTPHLPVVFKEDCSFAGQPIPATREAFVSQSRCALESFGRVVDALKKKGLYDTTVIILLSDHGQAIPSMKADHEGEWRKLSGWGNPLLAVKPLNARGPMEVSTVPRWLPEVPSIACKETAACEERVVAVDGLRVFNYYEWKNEYWSADSLPVKQYSVTGPPWKSGSWESIAP